MKFKSRIEAIRKSFKDYFNEKDIALPINLEPGKVYMLEFAGSGWTIQFKLVEADDLCYLDFYAYHRMTNSRHKRILENGELVSLENFWELGYSIYEDDPERTERERIEIIERNQRVEEILKEKGFL